MSALEAENKMVFGIAPDERGGAPFVILGIPSGAWEYMADGKTHTFDLERVGVPVKIIVYGGKDYAECMRVLEQSALKAGKPFAANKPLESFPIVELPSRAAVINTLIKSGFDLDSARRAVVSLMAEGHLKALEK